MNWQVRHQGSPRVVKDLTLEQVIDGLRDGLWEPTDEVLGPGEAAWVPIESHPQLEEVALDLEPPLTRPHEDETKLDMNALIDVTLVLLIFFILTTTRATALQKMVPLPTITSDAKKGTKVYRAEQVEKYMVRVQATAGADQQPVIRIIDSAGNKDLDVLQADGKTVDVEKLRGKFEPYVRVNPLKIEMALDARGVSWGTVVAIQDAAKGAGIRVVHHLYHKGASKER